MDFTLTDDQLDLRFDVAGNSGTGAGDLVFQRAFGTALTQPAAIKPGGGGARSRGR